MTAGRIILTCGEPAGVGQLPASFVAAYSLVVVYHVLGDLLAGADVVPSAYPALALAVTTAMLLREPGPVLTLAPHPAGYPLFVALARFELASQGP